MPLSNKELIKFLEHLEGELLEVCPDVLDLLPVIRAFVYFSQRHKESKPENANLSLKAKIREYNLVSAVYSVVSNLHRQPAAKRLFLAPAQHRNTKSNGRYISKHLDSLASVYGTENDLIWEVGVSDLPNNTGPCLPYHVSRAAYLLSFSVPSTDLVKCIGSVIEQVLGSYANAPKLDLKSMSRRLIAHEISHQYYKAMFTKWDLAAAYVVVYYSFRHLPIISALNEIGVESIEYQHGVQNDLHPMYTHWGHLDKKPGTLPSKMLLWDQVAKDRVDTWGEQLGVSAEVVGNLWQELGYGYLKSDHKGNNILVALQIYPEFFNLKILEAIRQSPEVSWVFRVHPKYGLSKQHKVDLLSKFSNIRIVYGEDESLEESLTKCGCCITGFSTVGLEALAFGVTTIFTHRNAQEGLAPYIDNRRCYYADDAAEILRIATKALKKYG